MLEWKINQLVRVVETGLVNTIHYMVIATQDQMSVGIHGAVSVTGDPSSPSFVAYQDLTQEQVIGWVKESLGAEAVAEIETKANQALQEKINPVIETGVPWGQA